MPSMVKIFKPTAPRPALLCVALALMLFVGCARVKPSPDEGFEYRYRVYESQEKIVSPLYAPLSDTLVLQKFLNAPALNRSMDSLSADGFKLWRIEAVAGSSTQYTFTFRRAIPEGFRTTRAPMEFTGVYQAQPPADANTYFAFEPRFKGYAIFEFIPGQPAPKQLDANWDPKTKSLHVQEGSVQHNFSLSADGLTVGYVGEGLAGDRLDRKIVYLQKIQSGE